MEMGKRLLSWYISGHMHAFHNHINRGHSLNMNTIQFTMIKHEFHINLSLSCPSEILTVTVYTWKNPISKPTRNDQQLREGDKVLNFDRPNWTTSIHCTFSTLSFSLVNMMINQSIKYWKPRKFKFNT
jgi:hypothetical protein